MTTAEPTATADRETLWELTLEDEEHDADWDRFVASARGHLVQTSLWGQVYSQVGWRARRLVARQSDRIVGGLQLLLRPLPAHGAVAYVSKGPVVVGQDPALARRLLGRLHRLARQRRVRCLVLQPPDQAHWMTPLLTGQGFARSPVQTLPVGTTRIDLRPEPEEILAGMSRRTRYRVRLSERRGIVPREATRQDLPTFFRLLLATAARQGFKEFPRSYFERMWEILEPRGHLKIFLAELEAEPISALLVIAFGDTVIVRKAAWSGEHGSSHPNEGLHWLAIRWARANGFRYYDFEGITEDIANAFLAGEEPKLKNRDSFSRFKLGFRGEVVMNPATHVFLYNPLLGWLYRSVYMRFANSRLMKGLVDRFLGRRQQQRPEQAG